MAPRQSTEQELDELEQAAASADASAIAGLLQAALQGAHYRVAALAAHVAGDRLVYECVGDLIGAYSRFLVQPIKRDPNCIAKKAIVRALYDLDCADIDFWLDAIRYQQQEPVWGGSVDTAADLRSTAAMGLVSSGYPRALVEIAELLTDSEAPVRSGAVRAIACGNPREAELLLRAKVFSGDEESFVIGECFSGLLTVEPDESLAFVAGYLDDDNEDLAEASALALGESRVEGAVERIRQVFEGVHVPFERRQLLVRAAALHRSEEAFDWLLELVAGRDNRIVEEIVDALAIYRHNEKLARRLRKALGQREDAAALAAFDKHWT